MAGHGRCRLLELPQAQFLLMSATLGDVSRFEEGITDAHRPADTTTVSSAERPIPLHYYYHQTPVHETLEELLSTQAGAGLCGAFQPDRGDRPAPRP